MMRNVVLGVCGLLIALVAISVGGALMLRVSGVDELMREAQLGIEGKAAKRAIADGRDPEQHSVPACRRWTSSCSPLL